MVSSHSPSIARLLGIALLCVGALSAGCASRQPAVSDGDATEAVGATRPGALSSDQLRNRAIAVRTASTPSFYADTSGRRTFGILGVIAMVREGNRLVKEHGLEDPAAQLAEEVLAALASRNAMRTTTRDSADLLLDVTTINWDFRPYRNDPENLYVVYSARFRLSDLRNGTVLAEGKCRSRRDPDGDSATLDQLLAEGARRLQDELREAGRECAQVLKEDVLSAMLQGVPPVVQDALARNPREAVR